MSLHAFLTALFTSAEEDEMLAIPEGAHYYTPYGRRIRDAHDFGPSTWLTVLEKSINSGMAIVAGILFDRCWRRPAPNPYPGCSSETSASSQLIFGVSL